jgi:transposase
MKRYLVNLTEPERADLRRLTTTGRVAASRVMHARILLKADEGLTDEEIADHVSVGVATIERVRRRFVLEGLAAALERKKQENPRALKLDGEAEARLVQLACSSPPPGRQRWTLHLLADKLVELQVVDSISHETVRQRLEKKRAEALADRAVLHSARAKRGVCARDGRRPGGLSPAV